VGGAELFDVLCTMYRIDNCTEGVKRYHMNLLLGLNVACINSWILYKHHCSQLAVPGKERLDILGFASQCLVVANKSSVSRESSTTQKQEGEKQKLNDRKVTSAPMVEIHFGHCS